MTATRTATLTATTTRLVTREWVARGAPAESTSGTSWKRRSWAEGAIAAAAPAGARPAAAPVKATTTRGDAAGRVSEDFVAENPDMSPGMLAEARKARGPKPGSRIDAEFD
eukprot:461790-Prymnesium_polylepis.1